MSPSATDGASVCPGTVGALVFLSLVPAIDGDAVCSSPPLPSTEGEIVNGRAVKEGTVVDSDELEG